MLCGQFVSFARGPDAPGGTETTIERAMPAAGQKQTVCVKYRTGYACGPGAPDGTETTIERAMPAAEQK